ncbi:penicillin-binding protein 1C [Gluconacetobacter sacchari]|uniref:penicillin-binding protein 1C n=1 Tax=Gluconacetobacter sacchari TaxID=92759 RepID=UPI0039B39A3B
MATGRLWPLGAAALLLGGLLLLDRLAPPDLTRARQFALILDGRDGTWLDGHTSADGLWRLPVRARDVDPFYLALLLKTEDRRFAAHPGVDPAALARAAWQFARRGHVVSGGSTLAMQVARLLTPHRHTLAGKVRDLLRALQLQWRFGRAGILDLYLTLAPEGRNIEGVRAASLLYFGHEPARLTPAEAAFLVALPRRPSALRPDRHPAALVAAARAILARGAPAAPAVLSWQAPRPPAVPHDAPELLGHMLAARRAGIVTTTLDPLLQREIRRMLAARPAPLRGTFATLVVDRDRTIAAWIGGAEHACPGQAIDLVRAPRSPGSTLKPFVYGMAFEAGRMTPRTRVNDIRMAIGGYAPLDFDRRFRGETTVGEALRLSLNIPAIQALRSVGAARFMARMRAGGATLRLPRGAGANLAIVLGGVDLSLFDLTMLYTALNHDGMVAPLRIAPGPAPPETRLLSQRAARDVRAILRGTAPPDGTPAWDDVAFKTGTSFGSRDGWAMAATARWTVGIWAGRPDGTASPGLTGRDTAAPVLADILSVLAPADLPGTPDAAPAHQPMAALSPALRRLPRPDGPQVVFPRDHADLESRSDDGAMVPIGLEASGGRPPYRWFVNGAPLAVPLGARPSWTPDMPGFAHLTVQDATGRHASADIRIR